MGKGHRRCEICGIKEAWHTGNKLLFSKFPLDPTRCREWLKAVGNEELVHLPIEKLHEQRNVCADHFGKKDFNKKGNRLKRHAIPTLHLMALPLTDGQLAEFPQHMYGHSESKGRHAVLHGFPNPDKDRSRFNTWLYSVGSDILGLENAHILKFRRVCRRHFPDKYLCRNNRLSNIAVPTLYLPVSAPGASRVTGPTVDIIQTSNSSGETKTITEALPTSKSLQLKPIIEDKVQDTTETTQELPSCSTTVENTDIFDDDDDADDDSDTLVESNVCRVCLAMDVKMYDLNDTELREMFQNITGIAVTEINHPILERLCWECAGRLKAAAAFRNKALLSDALLQGLASTGKQIRKNDITLIKENEDYLKSVGSMSAVEVFHVVDIDPENDSVPPVSENNDTKIVQKTVRNDSIKLKKYSIIKQDNNQMDVEAPVTTEVEYDQFDHIRLNTGEENSNNLETNPVVINNVPFREDTINSANSSPPPSSSRDKPKYPIRRGYLLKPQSDFEDKIKKSVIKITKRDSTTKIVSKKSNEVIRVKSDAKLKNIYVKIGGIRKKTSNLKLLENTQVKANTPTDEECMRLEDFDF